MRSLSGFFNDGTSEAPKLRVYLNLGNLVDLRPDSIWMDHKTKDLHQRLTVDGFDGVQLVSDEFPISESRLPYCGHDRINLPSEAETIIAKHVQRGDQCITVHVGWGMEDDDEVSRLVDSILQASERHAIPVFLETHRATITQDLWRTIQIVKRFPEVRFNGDFSHYYCGQELVYGSWTAKLHFMKPIFERTGFLHGRIASPGCMQVPIVSNLDERPIQAHGDQNYLEDFKQLWTHSMLGFLRSAVPGDVQIFAPELLASTHYYARKFPDAAGLLVEESDRYAQALLYKELAIRTFAEAQRLLLITSGND